MSEFDFSAEQQDNQNKESQVTQRFLSEIAESASKCFIEVPNGPHKPDKPNYPFGPRRPDSEQPEWPSGPNRQDGPAEPDSPPETGNQTGPANIIEPDRPHVTVTPDKRTGHCKTVK
jgi:hypothetical protein